jgi:uncharacterized protein YbjT (DUF2867 family)
MRKIILVAGATGDLGSRIVKALLDSDVEIRVVIRSDSNQEKIKILEELGGQYF